MARVWYVPSSAASHVPTRGMASSFGHRPLGPLVATTRHICRLRCALCFDLAADLSPDRRYDFPTSQVCPEISPKPQCLRFSVTDTLSDTPVSIACESKSAKEVPQPNRPVVTDAQSWLL